MYGYKLACGLLIILINVSESTLIFISSIQVKTAYKSYKTAYKSYKTAYKSYKTAYKSYKTAYKSYKAAYKSYTELSEE